MNIAIFEPTSQGHSTYVETMISVFGSDDRNKITLFAHAAILKVLDPSKLKGIQIHEVNDAESASALISNGDFQHIICVTLEPVSKNTYSWARNLLKCSSEAKIHFVVHNLFFWKPLGFIAALKFALSDTKSFSSLLLNLRKWFLYIPLTRVIMSKVNSSKGNFILISDALREEFQRQLALKNTWVIPFSVFTATSVREPRPTDSGIRICIPGIVSSRRRDYHSVLEAMQDPRLKEFRNKITWDLLGRINKAEGGAEIEEKCRQLAAQGHQILLHGEVHLPMEEFDTGLREADLILGNLNISVSRDSHYGVTKESGLVYNMIKAAKPGLIKDDYRFDHQLRTSVMLFHDYRHLPDSIIQLFAQPGLFQKLTSEALMNARQYSPDKIYSGLFPRN